LMHASRTPPPSHLVAELFAELGAVKVDRPEGGDPMYSWGGTLTAPSSAYNPASRWEGGISSPPAVLRRHYSFLLLATRQALFAPHHASASQNPVGGPILLCEHFPALCVGIAHVGCPKVRAGCPISRRASSPRGLRAHQHERRPLRGLLPG
jgi:hypothetical protein